MASVMVILLLPIIALVGVVRGGVTVRENAPGSAVVDAVIDLITQSCLFDNDRLMLRRIAYVETKDGASNRTFTQGGGIWQVYDIYNKQESCAIAKMTARCALYK